MQSATIATDRASTAWRRSSMWRLVAAVALLVVLNGTVAEGGLWVFRQIRPSGQFLLYFSLGWPGVDCSLLALWLTWGPGSFVGRLILSLFVIAVRCATAAWNLLGPEFGLFFVWSLMISSTIVLGSHGVMLPFRDSISWRIVDRGTREAIDARPWQWSIQKLLTWTTFLAIPLAMGKLANELLSLVELNPTFWFALCSETAIGLLGTGALAIAVLTERLSWATRLILVAAVPLILFGLRLGYVSLYNYPDGVRGSAWWSAGLGTGALVNLMILRRCGLRWKRAVVSPTDSTLIQGPPHLVVASGQS